MRSLHSTPFNPFLTLVHLVVLSGTVLYWASCTNIPTFRCKNTHQGRSDFITVIITNSTVNCQSVVCTNIDKRLGEGTRGAMRCCRGICMCTNHKHTLIPSLHSQTQSVVWMWAWSGLCSNTMLQLYYKRKARNNFCVSFMLHRSW